VGSPEPWIDNTGKGPMVCFAIINEGDVQWLTWVR
jgi:hypothetical protein